MPKKLIHTPPGQLDLNALYLLDEIKSKPKPKAKPNHKLKK